jgi:hypothetical protein
MDSNSSPKKVKGKKLFVVLTLLVLVLAAANVLVYLTRTESDTFVPATYKTLYHPTDVPTLAGTRIVSRGQLLLRIKMKEQPGRWTITDDTGERYVQTGNFPVVKLKDFQHGYEIEAPGRTPPLKISVHFGFYRSEYYKKGGRTQADNYWLISASIPMGRFCQYPLARWVDTFPYVDETDKAEARRIIREEMAVTGSEGTLERIDKVCAYLIGRWKKQGGTPDDRIEAEISPLKIFQRVCAGKGKIWCSQHALIYHFFANLAGIPTRLLSLNGRIDKVITTGHAFAESFVAEQGCWARIDPSINKFYVWNKENRLLNSADILHAVINGSFSDLSAKTLKEGQVVTVPYTEVNASDLMYFSPGANLIYRRGNVKADKTIARYLFEPNLAYSLDAEYANRVYLCRRLLFGIWAALLIAFLLSLVRYLMNRSKKIS